MSGRVIDSRQFSGDGAIFALILAHVRADYWYAPKDSEAYRTAKMFIDGGTCTHGGIAGLGYTGEIEVFDWKEHRDMIVGSLGLEIDGFVRAVKGGPRAK